MKSNEKCDWYRKETWNKEAEEDFYAHLKRSRRGFNRLQYILIQANTLLRTNDDSFLDNILKLLEQFFAEYSEDGESMQSECFTTMGKVHERLKNYDKAAEFYEKGAHAEQDCWSIRHGADLEFARFILVHNLNKHFDNAEKLLLNNYGNSIFPIQIYKTNLLLAIFAKYNGDNEKSRQYKEIAERAALEEYSGVTYHQKIGLVEVRDDELEYILNKSEQ